MTNKKAVAKKTAVDRNRIINYLNNELHTSLIKDVSCNGLQVQGTNSIKKIALVVDASMEAYTKAAEQDCQMIIAHHGIIWDGIRSVSGATYQHIKFLLANDLNLYASHLPLDLHPQLGNNAQLAFMIGLKNLKPFGTYKGIQIGFEGSLSTSIPIDKLVHLLCGKLEGECTVLPFGKEKIKRIAIVSGGAAGELGEAIDKGVDCYITGESSHENYHLALESNINVIYAGHYHTEKPGVMALGKALEKKFTIKSQFIDIPTSI